MTCPTMRPYDDKSNDMGSVVSGSISEVNDDNYKGDVGGGAGAAEAEAAATSEEERATLARKENVAVVRMKIVVFVVLLSTCLLVALGVYWYTRNDQIQDFEGAFEADAAKLIESFHMSVKRTLEAVDALSVTITSHALQTGSTFPNVTLPDFSTRFANTRILSNSVYVQYMALLANDTVRAGWEEYSRENRHLYDEALAAETALRSSQDRELNMTSSAFVVAGDESNTSTTAAAAAASSPMERFNDGVVNLMKNGSFEPVPPNSGPYLALWQISPTLPIRGLLNANLYTHPIFTGLYQDVAQTGLATINVATNLNDDERRAGSANNVMSALLAAGQFRHTMAEYEEDPVSNFGYPVFDSFDLQHRTVVGILGSTFYWSLFFKNSLPRNTRGIYCVLENSRGQTFTYLVEGDDQVTYLGDQDSHDQRYNHMEVSSDIASYLTTIASAETKSYTSVRLNTDFCNYKLRIFPSNDNEAQHVNRNPAVIAAVIVLVFMFTSVVFVVYTIAVGRRQQVVMNRAVASSAIVSSLFPSQVRDQIYKESEAMQAEKNKTLATNEFGSVAPVVANARTNAPPIAELFGNTTILFADLVGFTNWSSTRTPVQVFELLETLYQAFDALALRRNVFKVETIGDCYVAATGLPKPQVDHAVIMVRFAQDCMDKMGQLTAEMAEVLGEDTAKLSMRVGLHSGSVTGGVLRGQKSRFQLFGDAMNTASRMESNGAAGRIHVSQATANELAARGRSKWITMREDKIVAKGKGELQTYWATPRSAAHSVSSSLPSGFVEEDDTACCEA